MKKVSEKSIESFVKNIDLPNQPDTDAAEPKTRESRAQEPESESPLQFTNKLGLEKLKDDL